MWFETSNNSVDAIKSTPTSESKDYIPSSQNPEVLNNLKQQSIEGIEVVTGMKFSKVPEGKLGYPEIKIDIPPLDVGKFSVRPKDVIFIIDSDIQNALKKIPGVYSDIKDSYNGVSVMKLTPVEIDKLIHLATQFTLSNQIAYQLWIEGWDKNLLQTKFERGDIVYEITKENKIIAYNKWRPDNRIQIDDIFNIDLSANADKANLDKMNNPL